MTQPSDSLETPAAYPQLLRELRETAVLGAAAAALAWDQETMMPPAGAGLRADQLALLAGIAHERRTAERVGNLIAACEADPALRDDPAATANLREIRRDYDRATRLPTALVRELAQTRSLALEAWKDAREASEFERFAPWLERILDLSRSVASCYSAGTGADAYDALLNEYEPGMRATELERIFAAVRQGLAPLVAEIAARNRHPDDAAARVALPIPTQIAFNQAVAARIGFDFSAGRIDTSTHPFCEGLGPGDTRLTTRFRETGFPEALSSTMHEAGHGLYEQGLRKAERFGQPLGEAVSLGIHESQSRLWENMVGRSQPFWQWALPEARRAFGSAVERFTPTDLYRTVNRVMPGLIRVESDEATYNLHVMLRFDLERALLAGDLAVADLPAAWNERMFADLGLEVPDARNGALQDIHWSMGMIGYFPTYTLGNLYAAQFWAAARRELPALDAQIAAGEVGPLLGWLRENLHRHGRRYSAAALCERVTGEALGPEPLRA